MFQEGGSVAQPPWRGWAFVVSSATQCSTGLLQQHASTDRLKCRRRRPSTTGIADCLHAVPLLRDRSCSIPAASSSFALSQASIRRSGSHTRRRASGVAGAQHRRSLSSAVPQTLADPASVRSGRGIAAAEGIDVGMVGGGGGLFGDVAGVSVQATKLGEIGLNGQTEQLQQEVPLNGSRGKEVVEAMDEHNRQVIGELKKLARSGLWKASFKVLRVEQTLHAGKMSSKTAQANGEEYSSSSSSSSSWPAVEQRAYNLILAALSRAKRWEEAVLLLKEMETKGIRRDVHSYSCVISACGRGMQWEKALTCFAEMRELGIEPNSFVYSAAIDACGKGRQWQKALMLLRDMEVVDGLPANLICFNAAADACGKAGRPGEALALLAKMKKVGIKPNGVSYLFAVSACARAADWRQALLLLDEMVAFGVKPDLKCYCSAITACGKGGMWKHALELLDVMHRDGPPPNEYCYNAAISACGKSGQWRRAKELLVTMGERGIPPDIVSYNSAIDACGKSGRWKEAVKIFDDMAEASKEPWNPEMGGPKPPTPNATTYGSAITACSRGNQWEMALRFLDDMETKGVERTDGVFKAALAGCARMGKWRECIITLDQMRRSGLLPPVSAYNSVITACGRGGEWQRAISVLQQMSSRGAMPDVITLNAVMFACAQSSRWVQAKTILDFMRDPHNVPTTEYGGLPFPILKKTVDRASADLAMTGAKGIDGELAVGTPAEARGGDSDVRSTVDAPSATAAVWRDSSSDDTRVSALMRRQTRGDNLWPPRPDAFSFHTVIKALASAGRWRDAVELLEEMVEERRRFLEADEAFLDTTAGGSRQWPVNVDIFRTLFEPKVKRNGPRWAGHAVSPEASLRARALDVLRTMEKDEEAAILETRSHSHAAGSP